MTGMRGHMCRTVLALLSILATTSLVVPGLVQAPTVPADLDTRVRRFLDQQHWHDLNVPEADGRALHEIVLKNGYRQALEIGTSTGHSGIWIAWALAKTGGRLVTIEIDPGRHQQAVKNFKAAGLDAVIDARLGDAHDLVPRLAGPFDFVFIDADKDWYTNYAKAVLPNLRVGGCLTAHNVYPGRGRWSMTGDFYDYLTALPFLETSVTRGGLSVSYKRRER